MAPPQFASNSYYVRDGNAIEVVDGDPARANYSEWQVWLYSQSMRVPRGLDIAYLRWGVIQGPSAGEVMKQLADYQQFERAYRSFFGANTWGRFIYSNAVGPIAVEERGQGGDLPLEIGLLNQRLRSVVAELSPSLVNGDRNEATVLVQQYFEQVRNSMQDVARFYDKLSRLPAERNYLSQVLKRLSPGVNQAESAVPKVRAILPSVKLPASKDWMDHTEWAGKEGTVDVTVTEMGSSAWVQESWTGGDGSMSGTKIITIVPYQDIGTLDVEVSRLGNDQHWILRIQPADPNGFPQSVTSPDRTTATRTYPAVNLKTSEEFLHLEFSSPSQAQDAYAFFLYHKERGI